MVSRCAFVYASVSITARGDGAEPVELSGLAAALEADDACRITGGDEDAKCALGLVQLRSRQLREEAGQPLVKTLAKSHGKDVPPDLSMSQSTFDGEFGYDDEFTQTYSVDNLVANFQAYSYDHPDWLSDCSSIFLDVGASIGTTVRKFFEPEKYPKSPLLPHLEGAFGSPAERRKPGKNSGLCAIGLEPNPRHYSRHASIEAAYQDRGWHAHIYPYAAWFGEGVMSFNTTGKRVAAPDDVTSQGAHLSSSFVGRPGASGLAVRTVDFAAFLKSLIDHAAEDATVDLMVMDIEGAEYESLGQLIHENALCKGLVKSLLVEAHQWGDIRHWAEPGQKHARSFSEISRRLGQLRTSHACAKGVADVQEFSDASYAQDVDEKFGSGHGRWREPSTPTSQATDVAKAVSLPEHTDSTEAPTGSSSGGSALSEETFVDSALAPTQENDQAHHQPSWGLPTLSEALEHEASTTDFAPSPAATAKTQHAGHAKSARHMKHAGHVKHAGHAKLPTLADILAKDGESLPTRGSKAHVTSSAAASMESAEVDTAIPAVWRLNAAPASTSSADAGAARATPATQAMHASPALPPAPALPAASQTSSPRAIASMHGAGTGQVAPGRQAAGGAVVGKAPKELDEVLAIVAGQISPVRS